MGLVKQLELICLYFPTPTRLVENVVITTNGLQDRNIHILDGTTVENKGKLILTEIFPSVQNMIFKSIVKQPLSDGLLAEVLLGFLGHKEMPRDLCIALVCTQLSSLSLVHRLYRHDARDKWPRDGDYGTAPLTNSMAYGTRRFNAAFTRALQ